MTLFCLYFTANIVYVHIKIDSDTYQIDAENCNIMSADTDAPSTSKRPRFEPANDGTRLTDLNDDCLISIFRHLRLRDLNAVSATCKRFRAIAINHVYRYQPSLQHFDIGRLVRRYGVEDARCYLQQFGQLIQHIDFDNGIFLDLPNFICTEEIFTLIVEWCMIGLKSLQTRKLYLDSKTISYTSSIFSNLTKLETDNHLNLDAILPKCAKLTELYLWITENPNEIPYSLAYNFPGLKTLVITVLDEKQIQQAQWLLKSKVKLFLNNHLNLTRLTLELPYDFDFIDIGQLKHLEELCLRIKQRFHHDSSQLEPLNNLSKLRKVEMRFKDRSIYSKFLKQSASSQTLEHLKLIWFEWDEEFVDGLSRFQNLRSLRLYGAVNLLPDISSEISQRLNPFKHLNEIHFRSVKHECARKFLNFLTGAVQSIRSLTLSNPKDLRGVDDEYISTLAKFVYLQNLHLGFASSFCNEINCQPFQRLTRLKKLLLTNVKTDSSDQFLENILTNLGSRDSLKVIKVKGFTASEEFITTIGNFVNLSELSLFNIGNVLLHHLGAFGQLKLIRLFEAEIEVTIQHISSDFTINSIVSLTEKWPRLELFDLRMIIESVNRNKEIERKILYLCDKLERRKKSHPNFRTAKIVNRANTFNIIKNDLNRLNKTN